MLVKSQVKYIQSLGHKKFRDAEGVFVAEGPKIVSELLQSDKLKLVHCFATAGWLNENMEYASSDPAIFVKTDEKQLERISFHPTPNQVLAVFTKPVFPASHIPAGVTLLLDTIQDPGNLGTILRTADWFGVQKIVCSESTTDAFSPKVVQSAMGSIVRVELTYTDLQEYIGAHSDIPLYATALDGEDLQGKIQLSKAFLLIGNESRGVSQNLEKLAVKRFRIPGKGGAESLNAAVATGILLSQIEVLNQTR
jgi:RNA methyltransferase, TrmH family